MQDAEQVREPSVAFLGRLTFIVQEFVLIAGSVWLLGCQALLAPVVLRYGNLADPCDAGLKMSTLYSTFDVVGFFCMAGGLIYGSLPAAIVLGLLALFARWKGDRLALRHSLVAIYVSLAFLVAALTMWVLFVAPGPSVLRILLVAAIDVALWRLFAFWRRSPAIR